MTNIPDTDNRVTVLGAGSWGTALAILLAGNGFQVSLWGRHRDVMATMAEQRVNTRYLPSIKFPDRLNVEPDFHKAVSAVKRILVVVPSHAFPDTLDRLHAANPEPVTVVWGTKGLAPGGGRLLSELAAERLGKYTALAVISGPSFATEVARQLPAALTVASHDIEAAEVISAWFRNDRTRIYASSDMAGVQLGGAIKNVMAIATGISDGLGLGANSRAALITRGLAELTRLGQAFGGRIETFMGLTGVGDLILTCTDDQSRNRRIGLGLGRGQTLAAVRQHIGQETEGVDATRELYNRSLELGIDMPITTQVYRVLYEGCTPMAAVEALLTRDPSRE
ncbi:MAG: glycerol-3-phosphate dehydrogenase [NAD(P)+] [marine bacterium B5-7]|nr:MAG: glycerol-3-phosphate dehydrogenase [NAD(P)+] [marine bacterium B5-7]